MKHSFLTQKFWLWKAPKISMFFAVMRRFVCVLFYLLCFLFHVVSFRGVQAPEWWITQRVLEPGAQVSDYSAINQGQLKNLAAKAAEAMNERLPGGAGANINYMVSQWRYQSEYVDRQDYAVVNIGQLKTVALPFYQHLETKGLILPGSYPWASSTGSQDNYAVANIGQAKNLFSFHLPSGPDSDGDGITDAWENYLGSDPNRADANEDPNGTGLTNEERYGQGLGSIEPFVFGGTSGVDEFLIVRGNPSARPFYAAVDLGPAIIGNSSLDDEKIISISEKNGWLVTNFFRRWHNGEWMQLPPFPSEKHWPGVDSRWPPEVHNDGKVLISMAFGSYTKARLSSRDLEEEIGFYWSSGGVPIQTNVHQYAWPSRILYDENRMQTGNWLYRIIVHFIVDILIPGTESSAELPPLFWHFTESHFTVGEPFQVNRRGDTIWGGYVVSYHGSYPDIPNEIIRHADETYSSAVLECINFDRVSVGKRSGYFNRTPVLAYKGGILNLPEYTKLGKNAGIPSFINAPYGNPLLKGFYTVASKYGYVWWRETNPKTGKLYSDISSFVAQREQLMEYDSRRGFQEPQNVFAKPAFVSALVDKNCEWDQFFWEIHSINDRGFLGANGWKLVKEGESFVSQKRNVLLVPCEMVRVVRSEASENSFKETAPKPEMQWDQLAVFESLTDKNYLVNEVMFTEPDEEIYATKLDKEIDAIVWHWKHEPVTIRFGIVEGWENNPKFRVKVGSEYYPLKIFERNTAEYFNKHTGERNWKKEKHLYPYDPARPNEPKMFIPSAVGSAGKFVVSGYNTFEENFKIYLEVNGVENLVATFDTIGEVMLVDANRDGKIDDSDRRLISHKKPWRFWINYRNGDGDFLLKHYWYQMRRPTKALRISGRNELQDFFPVFFDLAKLLVFYPKNRFEYQVIAEEEEAFRTGRSPFLGYVKTRLKRTEALRYLKNDMKDIDSNYKNIHDQSFASMILPVKWYEGFNNEDLEHAEKTGGAVWIFEGRVEDKKPLILSILDRSNKKIVFTQRLPLSINPIEKMYRHLNLRDGNEANGGLPGTVGVKRGTARATEMDEPEGFPDSYCESEDWIVMLHGYNVDGRDAREWHQEMFKKLFWSKSKARFVGVSWFGEPDPSFPCPDYHRAVRNAFATAPYLAGEMNALPGKKTFIGHSLGTMVIASAATHHGMANKHLCFLNSAIATECFDTRGAIGEPKMWHQDWCDPVLYPAVPLAANWHSVFDSSDARSELAWNGLFSSISGKVHNFYSSSEDILEHNTDDVGYLLAAKVGATKGTASWVFQEKTKGDTVVGQGSSYGGWGFNFKDPLDPSDPVYWYWYSIPYPDGQGGTVDIGKKLLKDAAFIQGVNSVIFRRHPFFEPGWYKTSQGACLPIHGAPEWIPDLYDPAKGSSIAQVPFNKHRLLAEMIPALTWPTGSTPVDGIGGNYNMASEGNSSFNEIEIIGLLANKHIWPRRDENIYIWKHSDVRDAAYCFTYKIFDRIVELANPEPTTNNP